MEGADARVRSASKQRKTSGEVPVRVSGRSSPGRLFRVLPTLGGVFVLVGLHAFARDLQLDDAVGLDLGLAPEPRACPDVEGLVEDVGLVVLLLAEKVQPLAHVDVARGAGADTAAGAPLREMRFGSGLEQRRPHRDLDL